MTPAINLTPAGGNNDTGIHKCHNYRIYKIRYHSVQWMKENKYSYSYSLILNNYSNNLSPVS